MCDREAFDEEEPYTGSLYTLKEQASMGNLYAIYRLSCVYLDPNHEKYPRSLEDDISPRRQGAVMRWRNTASASNIFTASTSDATWNMRNIG